MPLLTTVRAVINHARLQRHSSGTEGKVLALRLKEVLERTWDLGFTAFGGPPVHFKILYSRFVEGHGSRQGWIDEQTFQELFAVCQSLPGPSSTKLVFNIALIHGGVLPAILAFLLWSLPGAIGMYGLSLGVQKMPERLPSIVYALLSGLNASTVGLIALAAVQLADKAINDRIMRILIILSACAGLCYNALWYFPVIIAIGGLVTCFWDIWLRQKFAKLRVKWERRRRNIGHQQVSEENPEEGLPVERQTDNAPREVVHRRNQASAAQNRPSDADEHAIHSHQTAPLAPSGIQRDSSSANQVSAMYAVPMKAGIAVIAAFIISFTIMMVVRGTLVNRPLAFDLFANMFLAGTVIFGGGPVVIPLLRAYVVEPGWVSPRDFLIGLAIIQAFPGPNFNFSVYLGALTFTATNVPTIFGSLESFLGIFLPGLTLALGVQSLWTVLRTKLWVVSILRGINATAIGLVFTAVYRLWDIGYLTPESSSGKSLAEEPWWVVIATVTYAESAWFGVSPPLTIVSGAMLGLGWYLAVGR